MGRIPSAVDTFGVAGVQTSAQSTIQYPLSVLGLGIQMRFALQPSETVRSWLQSQFEDKPILRISQLYSLPVARCIHVHDYISLYSTRSGSSASWFAPLLA